MTSDVRAIRVGLAKEDDGLVTSSMGACITVACLFSGTNKPGGNFTHASMKHLAGGYRTDFDWTSLIGNVRPNVVKRMCSYNKAFALVATSRDNYDTSDVGNVLGALRQLGFPPNNTIVDMMMSGGFAVNSKGEFGEPEPDDYVRRYPVCFTLDGRWDLDRQ